MREESWSDEQIIQAIQGEEEKREDALHYIYQQSGWKKMIIAFIMRNKGSEEDARDLFQEALVAFDREIREKKYDGTGNLRGYFRGIARHLWLNMLRSRKKMPLENTEVPENPDESYEASFVSADLQAFFLKMLDKLEGRCRRVMELWMLNYSMKEIAKDLGLANAGQAKKAKCRCQRKLDDFLDQNPNWQNFFK